MMRVWVKRTRERYEVWYQLTEWSPATRYRVKRLKSDALECAAHLEEFLRGGAVQGAPGQGSKRGAALPNDADAREKSLEDSGV